MDPERHHVADADHVMPQLATRPSRWQNPQPRPLPAAGSLLMLPEPSLQQWLRFGGKAIALAALGALPWVAIFFCIKAL